MFQRRFRSVIARPHRLRFRVSRVLKKNIFRSLVCFKGFAFLVALRSGYVSEEQIESIRKTIRRKLRRSGDLSFHFFPFLAVTKKPSEVRMGKGKGKGNGFVSPVFAGSVVVSLFHPKLSLAKQALKLASFKSSVPLRVL